VKASYSGVTPRKDQREDEKQFFGIPRKMQKNIKKAAAMKSRSSDGKQKQGNESRPTLQKEKRKETAPLKRHGQGQLGL